MVRNDAIRNGWAHGQIHHDIRNIRSAGVDEPPDDVAIAIQLRHGVELIFMRPALVVRGDQWGREGRIVEGKRLTAGNEPANGRSLYIHESKSLGKQSDLTFELYKILS